MRKSASPEARVSPSVALAPAAPSASATVDVVPEPPVPVPLSSLDALDALDDSDVFLCKKTDGETTVRLTRPSGVVASTEVTLFVHRWHQVEPGLLSWTFPSLRAALDAVQRMKNAIGWCVVSGTGWDDLDRARARGAILVEQLA